MTPGIDEFYQVKAVDKTGLFTRMKRVSISRGFDIQFPVVTDMANKSNATIRCADKTCPFKIPDRGYHHSGRPRSPLRAGS